MRRPEVLPFPASGVDEAVLERAVAAVAGGALLVYPTDTLYALGGLALEPSACARVREAKGRPERQPLPVVVADAPSARRLCRAWPEAARLLAEAFWPGPLTLVLPAAEAVPEGVGAGTGTVALRVPAHASLRRLCAAAGPLLSSSANRAGEAPPESCREALAAVGRFVDLALDGGRARPLPSTIVDLVGPPRLLRSGAVPREALRRVLPDLTPAGAGLID